MTNTNIVANKETQTLDAYKRPVENPDLGTLNADQKRAMHELAAFMRSDRPMHLLTAPAGCGKTYLMSRFIELFLHIRKNERLAVSAPTNRAVRVSHNMCKFTSGNLVFKTVHGLLKLLPKLNTDTGKMEFIPALKEDSNLSDYAVLVLDEASQLNDNLFELLLPYTNSRLKIIFVGDDKQIPPVGQENSIPFDEERRKVYNIQVTELTQVVRQAEGSPILSVGQKIRSRIYSSNPIPIKTTVWDEVSDTGVKWISHTEVQTQLEKYFDSSFLQNPNRCKVLAWRKRTVSHYNTAIRKILFPTKFQNKLVAGEKLIAGSTILDEQNNIIFPTYEQFEVVSFTEHNRKLTGIDLKYYEVKVISKSVEGMKEQTIIVIHEQSEKALQNLLQTVRKSANNKPKGSPARKAGFEMYHQLKSFFADVKYDYAWTAHTSQGSSIENVIVDFKDIEGNFNIFERNRIKYTGVTRAENSLIIIN